MDAFKDGGSGGGGMFDGFPGSKSRNHGYGRVRGKREWELFFCAGTNTTMIMMIINKEMELVDHFLLLLPIGSKSTYKQTSA